MASCKQRKSLALKSPHRKPLSCTHSSVMFGRVYIEVGRLPVSKLSCSRKYWMAERLPRLVGMLPSNSLPSAYLRREDTHHQRGQQCGRSASFKGHSRSPMPTPFRPIHSAQITVQRSATATPGDARSTSFRVTEYVQHHQACEVAEILRQTPLQPQAAHSPATISARPRQLSLRALFWARVCESVPALKAGNMPPLESAQERTRPLGLISDASSAMNPNCATCLLLRVSMYRSVDRWASVGGATHKAMTVELLPSQTTPDQSLPHGSSPFQLPVKHEGSSTSDALKASSASTVHPTQAATGQGCTSWADAHRGLDAVGRETEGHGHGVRVGGHQCG
jgi:hypothetical protein